MTSVDPSASRADNTEECVHGEITLSCHLCQQAQVAPQLRCSCAVQWRVTGCPRIEIRRGHRSRGSERSWKLRVEMKIGRMMNGSGLIDRSHGGGPRPSTHWTTWTLEQTDTGQHTGRHMI
ncbi:hypothetical protein RRG08_020751 [Elysia crispata]|uniref:Uncharacterized protein n=1 Tax=Elysia crispata TaxID=231223 RepID=A0AAE1ATB2_9GAST|nr:hypothetical protein RRG08_020751 [Elysia crispata]